MIRPVLMAAVFTVLTPVIVLGIILGSNPDTDYPASRVPGHSVAVFETPQPSWASHFHKGDSQGGIPPAWSLAYTPTPTPIPPTPTPIPPTPVPPTPEPVYEEPVYEEPVYEEPVYSGGDWVTNLVCSYSWNCSEALYVVQRESGGNPNATNASSGACGLFQLYPCPAGGYDPATNVALAYQKWLAGGGSFQAHWYNWW